MSLNSMSYLHVKDIDKRSRWHEVSPKPWGPVLILSAMPMALTTNGVADGNAFWHDAFQCTTRLSTNISTSTTWSLAAHMALHLIHGVCFWTCRLATVSARSSTTVAKWSLSPTASSVGPSELHLSLIIIIFANVLDKIDKFKLFDVQLQPFPNKLQTSTDWFSSDATLLTTTSSIGDARFWQVCVNSILWPAPNAAYSKPLQQHMMLRKSNK